MMTHRHPLAALAALALLVTALAGCAAAPTYADVRATAFVTGCWPDPYPTPRAATVTPAGGLAAPPPGTVPPGTPAASALPTTTPFPRCPAAPDATLIPWPTPVPPPAPYPTMAPRRWLAGSAAQTTLQLPNAVLTIDLAAHPTEGWPAVASVVWSGTEDPERVLVSVYHPGTRAWSSARQVDVGDAHVGRYVRTAQVAITGDGVVHAVWGMSDPDFSDNDPPPGVWASDSADSGASWSAPQRLATPCSAVRDLAASTDGWLAALLICADGPRASRPAVAIRPPGGAWQAPEALPFDSWYYSDGALAIVGQGTDTRAVGLVLRSRAGLPVATIVSRRLADIGPWQVAELSIAPALGRAITTRMWHARALTYERVAPDGSFVTAITFAWTEADASAAFALTSLDGGATWGPVEIIATGTPGELLGFAAPAYDPAADRLAAVWTCCALDDWESRGTTHFGSWSAPGSGRWLPAGRTGAAGPRVPLVLGSRSAFETVTAQAANSRLTWVAWVEQQQQVVVRSLDLNQIVPASEYPAPTRQGGTR